MHMKTMILIGLIVNRIDGIPDSTIRPPPTNERDFEHGGKFSTPYRALAPNPLSHHFLDVGRDTTTEDNVQRYQHQRHLPHALLPPGDPSEDESTRVSPDTELDSRDI